MTQFVKSIRKSASRTIVSQLLPHAWKLEVQQEVGQHQCGDGHQESRSQPPAKADVDPFVTLQDPQGHGVGRAPDQRQIAKVEPARHASMTPMRLPTTVALEPMLVAKRYMTTFFIPIPLSEAAPPDSCLT